MGLLSNRRTENEVGLNFVGPNRVDRDSLKPGDHIYSWRTAYIYAHHDEYFVLDNYCFVLHQTSWMELIVQNGYKTLADVEHDEEYTPKLLKHKGALQLKKAKLEEFPLNKVINNNKEDFSWPLTLPDPRTLFYYFPTKQSIASQPKLRLKG
ncbi:hypothetical protein RJ639_006007 [Escallonia herrerae]|uniref:Uncharacterized protein n=1 Tax=Escallonia herrerae TaxID=1293975 RepID=A0AA88W2B6_9ASTE|nr:hypothetical protein RJ639_006007 [Escallonia herrerae]